MAPAPVATPRHASRGTRAILGAGRVYGGGRVGCRFPGQNQINTSSTTLAPNPMTCAAPKLPLVQAIQAITATSTSTIIILAKRIRLAVMTLDLASDLGFGFVVRICWFPNCPTRYLNYHRGPLVF
jgi:hypothetical protein